MTLIDDIKRDREAGTPGPWGRAKSLRSGRIGDFNVDGPDRRGICSTGGYSDGKEGTHDENKANARRIARVPGMEAALLASEELATAADALSSKFIPREIAFIHLHKALEAYRAAISEASK